MPFIRCHLQEYIRKLLAKGNHLCRYVLAEMKLSATQSSLACYSKICDWIVGETPLAAALRRLELRFPPEADLVHRAI